MSACRTPGCVAPKTADHATLHLTRSEALIDGYSSLTRRLRELRKNGGSVSVRNDIIKQRSLLKTEMLRRMKWGSGS